MTAAIAVIRHNFSRIDYALAAIVVIFLLLVPFAPDQAGETLGFTVSNLVSIAPYLAASVLISAYAGASGADNLIAQAFTGRMTIMIMAAALVGSLSPFCSCGVIPLIAALLAMGVPLPAVMAFWLSSPIMDPTMFVLTMGTLGLPFAIGKTVAAFGIGLLGGFGTWAIQERGWLGNPPCARKWATAAAAARRCVRPRTWYGVSGTSPSAAQNLPK